MSESHRRGRVRRTSVAAASLVALLSLAGPAHAVAIDPAKASLGDAVWFDDNHNGRQDVDEDGVPNMTVILRDAAGQELARTTTNGTGAYSFDDLLAGTYAIEFDRTTLPDGYELTKRGARGTGRTNASDADPVSGLTRPIVLADGQHDGDWDAGIYLPETGAPTLAVTTTAGSATVKAGAAVTFTVTVRNTGTANARHVQVCDVLPDEMTFQRNPARARFVRGNACFALGTLEPGARKTVTVSIRVDATARLGPSANGAIATAQNAADAQGRRSVRITAGDPVEHRSAGVTG